MIIVLIISIALFQYFYFPAMQNAAQKGEYFSRMETVTEMVALGCGIGLGTEQLTLLKNVFDWAKKDTNLIYIVVFDKDGSKISQYPRGVTINKELLDMNQSRTLRGDTLFLVKPILFEGETLGTILIAASLLEIQKAIYATRSKATVVSLITLLIGFLMALLLGSYFRNKIIKLLGLAQSVASGSVGSQIRVTSNDEIGDLTKALNEMSQSLLEKDEDVETALSETSSAKFEAEEALKDAQLKVSYLDGLAFPVQAIDLDFKVIYANPAAAKVAGRESHQILGRQCYDVFNNSHCQTSECATSKCLKRGITITSETILNLPSGNLHVQYTAVPIRNVEGQVVGALEQMFDITQVKNVVDEVNAVSRKLKEGNLSERVNVDGAKGDYALLVESFNSAIENILLPINEAAEVLQEMAKGNLSGSVTGNYNGDHAKIKDAVNSTLDAFNEIISQIDEAVEQVASGSQQISDASQTLSEGATDQAASLQEVTASMTQLGSQTENNAGSAKLANQLVASVRVAADQGNIRMHEMQNAMREIRTSSLQVSKIIKVIDEIAFQTNMLALNAAVEAARAGVHGKGFAVVAEEVRNLAQRSAKAARETAELIEGSAQRVNGGTEIASQTAIALEEIVTGVAKVTELVGEIATASHEQSAGFSLINNTLGLIEQVTQANTTTAEETAAASQELSGQAEYVRTMISRFELRGGTRLSNQPEFNRMRRLSEPQALSTSIALNTPSRTKQKSAH